MAAVDAPPLGFLTKLAYALGAASTNLKARAIATFGVIFYNQVVGLPAQMVGGILAISLLFDAVLDPLLGQVSDNVRSRWGRRHPFMLAAALPYAVCFFLLWNPPEGWSDQALGAYLLAMILSIRFFDTFFELPHQALLPELARGYDERTNLAAMRQFFQVAGGLGMTVLAYQVFLKEQPDGTGGVLARDGYFAYSVVGAIIIFVAILISTFGTAHRIPYLAVAPVRTVTLKGMAAEMYRTLNNRSFIVLTLASMCGSTAMGARNGLELYFGLYFWGLEQSQLAVLATMSVVGGVTGVVAAPIIGRTLGKKWGAFAAFITLVVLHATPVSLRLLGLAPANGTPELAWLLWGEELISAAVSSIILVMFYSLISDVVEDAEVKTGRRSEGLLMSANNLMRKMVSSSGVLVATTLLTLIAFPHQAERNQVDPEVLRNLGLVYLPVVIGLYGASAALVSAVTLNRAKHDQNLEHLRLRKIEQDAAAARETPAGRP